MTGKTQTELQLLPVPSSVLAALRLVGDWIVGTSSRANGRQGRFVYVMRVAETLTYNEYWAGPRFRQKKPNVGGSLKQAFGDNIYFKDEIGKWHQQDSHHSYEGGVPNVHNIRNDTQTDRVLIGEEFVYWGGSGPQIDADFCNYASHDICAIRHHKSNFPSGFVSDFVRWFGLLGDYGYQGDPGDWT